MRTGYVCGWDGGGTKTAALMCDAAGNVIAKGVFGPLNVNGAGEQRVAESIRDGMAWMRQNGMEQCRALVIGAAGVSNQKVSGLITDAVRANGYAGPLRLLGDHEIALAGAIQGAGAALISGTGSICCGRDGTGRTGRAGGFGHLIDDGGSGYAIGRDILSAVVRAADGRAAQTALAAPVMAHTGAADVPQLITWLHAPQTQKKDVAALAPLLLPALQAGDEAAQRIAAQAAQELAALAAAVWRQLGLDRGELALMGSVLQRYEPIRTQVQQLCLTSCAGVQVVQPRGDAAQGAAAEAARLAWG